MKTLFLFVLSLFQERVIESLREQKEREDRVRLEELEQMRKENQVLKDRLSALEPQKVSQTQPANSDLTQNQSPDGAVSIDCFDEVMIPYKKRCVRVICSVFVNMFWILYNILYEISKTKCVVKTVCMLIRALYTRLIVWYVYELQMNGNQYFIVTHIIK